jgi:flavin reductase (DIM6/NTAB) family NADH-FMN oxidoreductase RutF
MEALASTAGDIVVKHAPSPLADEPAAWGNTCVQPKTLRGVFGAYPTGVAIVTTRTPEGRAVGLTINSFASLSLDPPLVLWSLVDRSPNLTAFRDCSHFAINVLASHQEELARRFANPAVADKFEQARIVEAPEGVPAIEGALAMLVCANDRQIVGGDHLLLVGRVLRTASAAASPLVFHAGKFTSLKDHS